MYKKMISHLSASVCVGNQKAFVCDRWFPRKVFSLSSCWMVNKTFLFPARVKLFCMYGTTKIFVDKQSRRQRQRQQRRNSHYSFSFLLPSFPFPSLWAEWKKVTPAAATRISPYPNHVRAQSDSFYRRECKPASTNCRLASAFTSALKNSSY